MSRYSNHSKTTLLKEFQLLIHEINRTNKSLTADPSDSKAENHFIRSYVPETAWKTKDHPSISTCHNSLMKNKKLKKYEKEFDIKSVIKFFSDESNEDEIKKHWNDQGILELLEELYYTKSGRDYESIKDKYFSKVPKAFMAYPFDYPKDIPRVITILPEADENKNRSLYAYFAAGFIERCLSRLDGAKGIKQGDLHVLKTGDSSIAQNILDYFNEVTPNLESEEPDLFEMTLDLFRYALCEGVPDILGSESLSENEKIQNLMSKLRKNNITIDNLNDYLDIIMKAGAISPIGNQYIFTFAAKQDHSAEKLNPLVMFELGDIYYYDVNGISSKPDYNKAYQYYKKIWNAKKYPPAGWSLGYMFDRYDCLKTVSRIEELEEKKNTGERRREAIKLFCETAEMDCAQSFTSLGNLCKETVFSENNGRMIWNDILKLLPDSDKIPFEARFLSCKELYKILNCTGISRVSVPGAQNTDLANGNLCNNEELQRSFFELFQANHGTINLRIDFEFGNENAKKLIVSLIQNSDFADVYIYLTEPLGYIILHGYHLHDIYGQNLCKKRQEELYRIAAEKGDFNGKNNYVSALLSKLRYKGIGDKVPKLNQGSSKWIEDALIENEEAREEIKKEILKHLEDLAESHYPNGENLLGNLYIGNDSLSNELIFNGLNEDDKEDKIRIKAIKEKGKNLLKRAAERQGTLNHTWAKVNYSKALHDLNTQNPDKFKYIQDAIKISYLEAHDEGIYNCYITALELANKMELYNKASVSEEDRSEIYKNALVIAENIFNDKIKKGSATRNIFTTELRLIRILLESGFLSKRIINYLCRLSDKDNNISFKLRFYNILLEYYDVEDPKEFNCLCNMDFLEKTCNFATEEQIRSEAPMIADLKDRNKISI